MRPLTGRLSAIVTAEVRLDSNVLVAMAAEARYVTQK